MGDEPLVVLSPMVGGQLVLPHEIERGADETRPTGDVDVVVDQLPPNAHRVAHRYRRRVMSIDVLAPDNLGR